MSAQGKCVLVIGGETAVGRAIAIGLAEAGADVAIASLSNDTKAEFAINSALNELWALGRKGIALPIDASDAAQLRDAVARAETELGELDLAVVVGQRIATMALDALPVVSITADTDANEALRTVTQKL